MRATINPLVADTATPPIPEAQDWLAAYDGRYGQPIDLAQAVPDYPPHRDLLAQLAKAAGDPASARYGAIAGDAALRAAYAGDVGAVYGADIGADDIAITAGCNQAFFVTMLALAKAGDAVLLPTPWYFNHQMTLQMLGVEARALPCAANQGFVPDPGDAMDLLDDKVKAIVLISPNNPTGAAYPAETIGAFAGLCKKRGIWLVIDETYRDFLPDRNTPPHTVLQQPDWRDHVIQLYSFSKSYCMPGHRVGAIAAGASLIGAAGKILDCVQICAPRAAQSALSWAIAETRSWRHENAAELLRRADTFRTAMSHAKRWRLCSIGAYFAYLEHPFAGVPARDVAAKLARERGLLVLPGSYFGPGQDAYLRVAFANVGLEPINYIPERLAGFQI